MPQIPLKVHILRNIKTHLQGLTPANGYTNDLSLDSSVIVGRPYIGKTEPLPVVTITEPALPPNFYAREERGPRNYAPWRLIFQCFTFDDKGSFRESEPAYILMAEVLKRLFEEKTRPKKFPHDSKNYFGSGNAIVDFKVTLDSVRPPDEYSQYSFGWLIVDFDLVQNYVDQWVNID
jgi:hypothetical protein